MYVFISIEVKLRELENAILLALEAASKGKKVIIGPKSIKRFAIKNDIYHRKSITPSKKHIDELMIFKKNEVIITTQDQEHGLIEEDYNTFLKARFSKESIKLVDKVFTWGFYDYNFLCKNFPNLKQKFLPSGSPKVDLWHNSFEKYYKAIGFDIPNDFIILSSNLGFPLNYNTFADLIYNLKRGGYFDRDSNLEDSTYEVYSGNVILLKEFVFLARYLASNFTKTKIVIRPHPIEKSVDWKKLIGDYENLIVTNEYPITHWLKKSKLVIHNGCTTGFEADALGVPVISYQPINHPANKNASNQTGVVCKNPSQVKAVIEKLAEYESYKLKTNKGLNRLRITSESDFAYKTIVNEWLKLSPLSSGEKRYFLNLKFKFKFKIPGIVQLLKKLYKSLIFSRISTNNSFISEHKFPGLEYHEVLQYVKAFQKVNAEFNLVKVKRLTNRTYLFVKK